MKNKSFPLFGDFFLVPTISIFFYPLTPTKIVCRMSADVWAITLGFDIVSESTRRERERNIFRERRELLPRRERRRQTEGVADYLSQVNSPSASE
jgi:hypothetical protein